MSDMCGCSRPLTGGGGLCVLCTDELEKLSAELPALIGLLYDAMGGQARFTASNGGGRAQKSTVDEDGATSIETGIDLPQNAVDASAALKTYLRRTTRLLMDAGAAHPIRLPADELVPMAWFLYSHLAAFRRLPEVYDLKEELRGMTGRIGRVVDRPADRVFAGICSMETEYGICQEDLYAVPGRATIQCRGCGFSHDVAKRRGTLRAAVADQYLTFTEIQLAFPNMLGIAVNGATLRKWKERKRLIPAQKIGDGPDKYLAGDVLALIKEAHDRAEAREQKKAG